MTVGVGNGVGGMLQPACQLTGLFTPATTVSVGSRAEWLFQSAIYYQAQLVNGFLTNHPIHTRLVKNFNLAVNYILTALPQERIIRAKMRKTVLKLWTGGVTQW